MVSFNTEVVMFFGTVINYLLSLKLSSLETCSVYVLGLIVYGKCRTMAGPAGETRLLSLSPASAVCVCGYKYA
jgi:hypothetical protein